jgi:hypothetical protein
MCRTIVPAHSRLNRGGSSKLELALGLSCCDGYLFGLRDRRRLLDLSAILKNIWGINNQGTISDTNVSIIHLRANILSSIMVNGTE